ncbi:MAG: hypothetical protein JWR89_1090 [Tardiphaga sp.]|nr:hypothetical protein [Tardiphaga sp.]
MDIKPDRDVAWCMLAAIMIGNVICAIVYLPNWY